MTLSKIIAQRIKPIIMNETQLRNQILDWLAYNNIFVWLNNTAGNYSKKTGSYYKNPRLLKGVPDILGILPNSKGRMLAIECKVGKNKLTLYQKEFKVLFEDEGGYYILAYNLDDVIESLNFNS